MMKTGGRVSIEHRAPFFRLPSANMGATWGFSICAADRSLQIEEGQMYLIYPLALFIRNCLIMGWSVFPLMTSWQGLHKTPCTPHSSRRSDPYFPSIPCFQRHNIQLTIRHKSKRDPSAFRVFWATAKKDHKMTTTS